MLSTSALYQYVYVSKATKRLTHDELVSLLQQARSKNTAKNVTGLLLYNGLGTFLQVIEGERESVDALIQTIQSDSRHTRVNILFAGPTAKRDFPDWQMGFRSLSDYKALPVEGFSDFLASDNKDTMLATNPALAMRLIQHFKSIH